MPELKYTYVRGPMLDSWFQRFTTSKYVYDVKNGTFVSPGWVQFFCNTSPLFYKMTQFIMHEKWLLCERHITCRWARLPSLVTSFRKTKITNVGSKINRCYIVSKKCACSAIIFSFSSKSQSFNHYFCNSGRRIFYRLE